MCGPAHQGIRYFTAHAAIGSTIEDGPEELHSSSRCSEAVSLKETYREVPQLWR